MPTLKEKARADLVFYKNVHKHYLKDKEMYGNVPNLDKYLKEVIFALGKLEKM